MSKCQHTTTNDITVDEWYHHPTVEWWNKRAGHEKKKQNRTALVRKYHVMPDYPEETFFQKMSNVALKRIEVTFQTRKAVFDHISKHQEES